MKLRDLDARFVWQLNHPAGDADRVSAIIEYDDGDVIEMKPSFSSYRDDCPSIEQAQGVIFLCPKCFAVKGSNLGVHSVLCWFRNRGVPKDEDPGPGRWTPSGTSLDDLTFTPGDPPVAVSVKLLGGCGWHGFIVNGDAS